MNKQDILRMFAEDVAGANRLLGWKTAIRDIKQLQERVTSERDGLVSELARRKLRDSDQNSRNAGQPRKDKGHVTAEAIEALRVEHMLNKAKDGGPEGCDHGWIKYAAKELKVDRKTIVSRWKGK